MTENERPVGLLGQGDAPGRDRRPRAVLQVGPLDAVELPEEAEVDRSAQPVDVGGVDLELAHEQVEHLVAHAVGDLEAHGLVEPPPAQLHLQRFEQVLGLLVLEGQVGVAGDPERRRFLDDHAGEQRVEVGDDQFLDRAGTGMSSTSNRRGKTVGTLTRAKRRSSLSGRGRPPSRRCSGRGWRCTGTGGSGRRRAASGPGRCAARRSRPAACDRVSSRSPQRDDGDALTRAAPAPARRGRCAPGGRRAHRRAR